MSTQVVDELETAQLALQDAILALVELEPQDRAADYLETLRTLRAVQNSIEASILKLMASPLYKLELAANDELEPLEPNDPQKCDLRGKS